MCSLGNSQSLFYWISLFPKSHYHLCFFVTFTLFDSLNPLKILQEFLYFFAIKLLTFTSKCAAVFTGNSSENGPFIYRVFSHFYYK